MIVSVGKGELVVASISRQSIRRTFATPFRSIGAIRTVSPSQVAFVGTGASTPAALITFDPTSDPASVQFHVAAKTTSASIDDGYVSASSEYAFAAGPDPGSSTPTTAYAKLLKPRNQDFVAPNGELPPCLCVDSQLVRQSDVAQHPCARRTDLSGALGTELGCVARAAELVDALPEVQYWTSAGWLVLDLDYGGSTGRGRAYRDRLVGNWCGSPSDSTDDAGASSTSTTPSPAPRPSSRMASPIRSASRSRAARPAASLS